MSATEPSATPLEEARRVMQICNACRYCEGFCAVYPAMARRLSFSEPDLTYLANLCHGCGACHYACQYAPPHEFNINVPKVFAEVRRESYQRYAWPAAFGALYERNGLTAALATAGGLALFFVGVFVAHAPDAVFKVYPDGSFYRLVPHSVMAWTFGLVGLFVLLAFAMGFLNFWRDTGEKVSDVARADAAGEAVVDALTLKYLDGGGAGCNIVDDNPSNARRVFHHFTFYGFMLCFAATSIATLYHYLLGWKAPYGYFSVPVLLGTLGGLGLLVGPAGLYWIKQHGDPETAAPGNRGMDVGFLALLFLTSLSGLLLMALRETAAMGMLLAIHLGIVLGMFLVLPYGKFVHGLYRLAALLRYALEKRRPRPAASFDG